MCTNCIFVLLPSTFSYTSIAKYPSDYGKCRPTSSLASEIGILFVYLNSSLNPFLYCWKIRAVRQEVENYKTMVLSFIGRIVALKTFYDWLMRIDGVHLGRTNLRRKSGN